MIGKLKPWEDLYSKRVDFDRDQYFVYHDNTGMYLPVWVGNIQYFGKKINVHVWSESESRIIYQAANDEGFKMYDCWFENIRQPEYFTDKDFEIEI